MKRTMSVMGARQAGLAEATERRVNEVLTRAQDGPELIVMCECAVLGCTEKLRVPREVYDRARATFELFVLAPGHEIDTVESVVEREDGWLLVRKRGEAADAALQAAVDG